MNLKLVKLELSVCVLLILILLAEWGYGEFAGDALQQSLKFTLDDSKVSSDLPAIAVKKLTGVEYNEFVERPLFFEDRKPVVETVAVKPKNEEDTHIDEWQLIGVYNMDKQPTALFRKSNEARKYLKIKTEQVISGWLLKEIQSDRVILQLAGQEKSVLLRKPRVENKSPVPVNAPVKPPAAGRPPVPGKHPAKPPAHAPNTNPENANDESE